METLIRKLIFSDPSVACRCPRSMASGSSVSKAKYLRSAMKSEPARIPGEKGTGPKLRRPAAERPLTGHMKMNTGSYFAHPSGATKRRLRVSGNIVSIALQGLYSAQTHPRRKGQNDSNYCLQVRSRATE